MTALPLSHDGAPPTQAEVLASFEGVLAGAATREDAAAWARARRDAPPARGQFGALPPGRALGFAFRALLASDVTVGTWTPAGPPYFIRLWWRPRGPTPDEAELYLEADGGGWAPDLAEVLAVLGLPASAITWRPGSSGASWAVV